MARSVKTDPPERLTDEDRAYLRVWAIEREPGSVRRLLDLEEACLDHFRANGKRMKDWRLTVKNWIRNEKKFSGRPFQPESPVRPIIPLFVAPGDPDARAELDRRREAHRLELLGKPNQGALGSDLRALLAERKR